jgi:hypothetical protein
MGKRILSSLHTKPLPHPIILLPMFVDLLLGAMDITAQIGGIPSLRIHDILTPKILLKHPSAYKAAFFLKSSFLRERAGNNKQR